MVKNVHYDRFLKVILGSFCRYLDAAVMKSSYFVMIQFWILGWGYSSPPSVPPPMIPKGPTDSQDSTDGDQSSPKSSPLILIKQEHTGA